MFLSSWNLWHSTLGASFTWLEIEFTAGMDFTLGDGVNSRFFTFDPDSDNIEGTFRDVEMSYTKIKFLLGLNLPFSTGG